MELRRANQESSAPPMRTGVVALCLTVLVVPVVICYFYGAGWMSFGTHSTPRPGTGIMAPEDPATADLALKAARLTGGSELQVNLLIRDFQMHDDKRPEIEARFGQKYLKCEVQRLSSGAEKGEAVLYRFADSAQARAAQAKISIGRNPATPTVQIGPVVVCVYGGKSVVTLAAKELRALSKLNEQN